MFLLCNAVLSVSALAGMFHSVLCLLLCLFNAPFFLFLCNWHIVNVMMNDGDADGGVDSINFPSASDYGTTCKLMSASCRRTALRLN